jgi:hypothetical protein
MAHPLSVLMAMQTQLALDVCPPFALMHAWLAEGRYEFDRMRGLGNATPQERADRRYASVGGTDVTGRGGTGSRCRRRCATPRGSTTGPARSRTSGRGSIPDRRDRGDQLTRQPQGKAAVAPQASLCRL